MPFYKKIQGERLYLSPLDVDSTELYAKWLNDPAVAVTHGTYGQVFSAFGHRKNVEKEAESGHNYTIVLNEGDRPIGVIALMSVEHLHQRATLGILVGEEDCRSKGYGTEAIKLLVDYGFKHLNLHNIMLTVFADNLQALACYKKAGFKEFGRWHECAYTNGHYMDDIFMEIINNIVRR
ncbi:MAG: GNAT family N-acetyltransferase [Oscillospiraceae bacterium]|jgi:RimJ/RimL family protein N-acetyltransferase|nr:GNAT family N-acetyltransferase [Oscillospiraceae bacterium]